MNLKQILNFFILQKCRFSHISVKLKIILKNHQQNITLRIVQDSYFHIELRFIFFGRRKLSVLNKYEYGKCNIHIILSCDLLF